MPTSAPPDNSTRAMDILGTRAALYLEYEDEGWMASENITDSYAARGLDNVKAPASGEPYVLEGIELYCDAEYWDEDGQLGNSGIVINGRTDEDTTFRIGGVRDLYEAPDGECYNSVIIMETAGDETIVEDSQEVAPGTGIAFNGLSLELVNV